MRTIRNIFAIAVVAVVMSGCGADFLEPTVATSKDLNTNINTVDDLNGIMLGAYERLSASGFYGRDVIVHPSTRSDDGYSDGNSGRFVFSGQFDYSSVSGDAAAIWNAGYSTVANCNIIIGSNTSDAGTPEVDHVKGEAYAVRALVHMVLLQYYGQQWAGGTLGVPVVTGYLENLEPSRNTVAETWQAIEDDLNMARSLMSESLNEGPVRMTTYGVAALQSRYYLYAQKWQEAIDAAEYVINSGNFTIATGANDIAAQFVGSGGSTSVFELAFNSNDNPGINGLYQIYSSDGYGDVVVTQDLIDFYEPADARLGLFEFDINGRGRWRATGKYPTPTWDDNIRVSRYAEVVLNYAEALFQVGGREADAITQLNIIASAAGASTYSSPITIDDVLAERRKELAFEGFRGFDLLRNGRNIPKVDPVNQTFTGSEVAIGESRIAFPIPEAEMNANSNMVQNDGY